ncbi:MAG: hypothetical protein ACP5MG_13430 [Verrucomicrobiia bacterium]
MEDNWAAEHLQIIRTLMERVALYRRALSPVMFLTGIFGIVFATGGVILKLLTPIGFVTWWSAAGVLTFAAVLLITRKQALKDKEPFWSGPTRRVVNSLLPPLFAGLALGLAVAMDESLINPLALSSLWVILYGIALYSASFFMQRGMKLFGFLFVLAGAVMLLITGARIAKPDYLTSHYIMGLFFGLAHLSYGLYLRFTEKSLPQAESLQEK